MINRSRKSGISDFFYFPGFLNHCNPITLGQWGDQTSQNKGNQHWILIERTDVEAPVFWSPDMNSRLIGKVPDAGKDWGQEEKRASEDEMAEWHHWCNGHEIGKTSGDGEGQGGLTCCSPQGCKESDTMKQLKNNSKVTAGSDCNH